LPVEGLRRRQPFDRQGDLIRRETDRAPDRRMDAMDFLQTFNAAQAAAGGTDEAPLPFLQCPSAVRTQLEPQFDAGSTWNDIQFVVLADVPDDAFGQAE